MPTIYEKPGRSFQAAGLSSSASRTYSLKGYADEAAATTALGTLAPAVVTVDGFPLATRNASFKDVGATAGELLFATVTWKHVSKSTDQEEPADGQKLSFNLAGPSTFFTLALSQQKYGTDARDVGLAIGVLEDGTVEGRDVPIPPSGFQVTDRFNIGANASAVNSWIAAREQQIHTKNQATYRGRAAGDVLLRSLSGEWVGPDVGDFALNYDFAISTGESSPTVDTGLTSFSIAGYKKGFDLVWVQYDQHEDTTNNVIVPKARGLYVAEVFADSDFSSIGV